MIYGIIYACQYLILERDETVMAEELMRESGFTCQEFLDANKRLGYEEDKIMRIIFLPFVIVAATIAMLFKFRQKK